MVWQFPNCGVAKAVNESVRPPELANKALEPTAYSVRSFLAPGGGSPPALGRSDTRCPQS
jgi:hypothetical protein